MPAASTRDSRLPYTERWAPIEGWPYEVSDHGRVRHARTKLVRRVDRSSRYDRIELYDAPRSTKVLVHHLVATAFLDKPPGPVGRGRNHYQINHCDGDRRHNAPGNLEWLTHADNHRHAAAAGLKARGERHGNAILNVAKVRRIRDRLRRGDRHQDIAAEVGVSRPTVTAINAGRVWGHVA